MSICNSPSISKTTCCDCPSQAEIDEFMNMSKEAQMKFMRDALLPPKIEFTLCQQCVVEEATPSITALYARSIPIYHRVNQQRVNTQLWEQWNIADHERAVEGRGWNYYSPEKTIFSPGVERMNAPFKTEQGPPPAPILSYTISSRRWIQEQEQHICARIGDIFFAKDGTPRWNNSVRISYALERVDEPRRWNKYCVHHLPSESFVDVIRAHDANDVADN